MITLSLLLGAAWKSAAVLGAAFGAAWFLRRGSASFRHFLWTAAFAVLLLLPFLRFTRPVEIAAPAVAVAVMAAPMAKETAAPVPWATYIWLFGVGLAAARFLAGTVRVAWLGRWARPADYARSLMERLPGSGRVRVMESAAVPVPLAWGLFRPVILLPSGAREWPLERLATVLRHEMAHISRGDLAAQYLAEAVCCLYWFQPLAWLAGRRQREERELACDDAVLASGLAAHEYATHLVEVTRSLGVRQASELNAPAMAGVADLESRVRGLFAPRDRRPLRIGVACAIAAVVLAVGLPVASLHVYAQATGSLAGVVQDPSGARVPKCTVVIKNLDGSNEETTVANARGEYAFPSIPVGRYSVTVNARGFAAGKFQTMVSAGSSAKFDVRIALGDVTESVTVSAKRPGASETAAAVVPSDVKLGGQVTACALVYGKRPDYPDTMKAQGIEGTVVIRAIISKDGLTVNPKVINTIDPVFAQAALDAVSKWRYRPATLNGEPVETTTTVSVDFKLEQ